MDDNKTIVAVAAAIVAVVAFIVIWLSLVAYFIWSADVKADKQCKEMTVAAIEAGRDDLVDTRTLPTCDWNYRR